MTFIPVAVRNGARNGSRERLLDVAARRPDLLTVRTNALVTRVVFEGRAAVGVEYLSGQGLYGAASDEDCRFARPGHVVSQAEPLVVRARHEVILAGGAFNTPQLLMLSGIGPKDQLDRLGIQTIEDAPGVGANLHDRYEVSVVTELADDYALFARSTLDVPPAGETPDALFAEWRDDADGPYTTNGSLAAIVARSSVAGPASDLIVFALPIDFRGYFPGYAKDAVRHHDRLSVVVLKAHTTNRAGTVRLRSANPRDVPDIDFRYFEDGDGRPGDDLRGVVDGIKIAREVIARLAVNGERELVPGAKVDTDERLTDFVRDQAWGHHACGTAKIGRASDPAAVVDGEFKVHGVERLRVVDASVFPDIPGTFIATAVYVISEKAADVITATHHSSHPSIVDQPAS